LYTLHHTPPEPRRSLEEAPLPYLTLADAAELADVFQIIGIDTVRIEALRFLPQLSVLPRMIAQRFIEPCSWGKDILFFLINHIKKISLKN